jgi:tetratricopeptide (TPR) repeat protein
MKNEQMVPTHLTFKSKKAIKNGEVIRTALFARFKVTEVETELKEKYYFIFYKNNLIYGDLLEHIEEGTFIEKAMEEGIVLERNHPFISVLNQASPLTIPAKNKLFSMLQRNYSLLEIPCITAALDSFFSKDQLGQTIEKIFFHFRRNGSFLKAFQSIRILSEFSPSLVTVGDILNTREFSSYANFYSTSSISAIDQKDPLYTEFYCFAKRKHPDHHKMLETLLKNQERYAEWLLVWMEDKKNLITESVRSNTDLALHYIPLENWILALSQANINPYQGVQQSLGFIEDLISDGQLEKAAIYLFPFIQDLPAEYNKILNELRKNLDAQFVASHLDEFLLLLEQIDQEDDPMQTEQRILQLIAKLMEGHDVSAVSNKLKPISKKFPHSLAIRKINKMAAILEDPDRMMELGQYYAEFSQYDQAIECFFWEMELKPTDPDPVWQLCKMYQHKGLVQEASAYQEIYTQLRSRGETG